MADYETLHVYVGYNTANNVSNFGGDPVTQLNLKTFKKINLSFCIPKYAQCFFNLHICGMERYIINYTS